MIGEFLARLGTWWRSETSPGRCRECDVILPDDDTSGYCSEEHQTDYLIRTDF